MLPPLDAEGSSPTKIYRPMLLVAGGVYLLWWFAVEALLPGAFNPFLSRFLVCLVVLSVWLASFRSAWLQARLRPAFVWSAWLITAHFFYLFGGNDGNIDWIVGSYITVTAVTLGLQSKRNLLLYSLFVLAVALGLSIWLPALRQSLFLPGLVTILIQANIGLHARLGVIANLNESNKRFRLLLDSTFEGIFVHEGSKIQDANQSLARMFGYSKDELVGHPVLDLVQPDERPLVMKKIETFNESPYEIKGVTKDGKPLALEVRGKNFVYGGEPARLVAVMDIGDRKKAEHERIQALAMAENVRLRDEFITIASHELRTPLSVLKLQGEMIERQMSGGETLSMFNRQVNRLAELVEAMLDISKISSGHMTLQCQDMDLVKSVRETIELLQRRPTKNGTFSAIHLHGPDRLSIWGDRNRIEQVVENLLTNSLKFGSGQPIEVRLVTEAGHAVLTVQDHGIGIPSDSIQRIFERFERATTDQNIGGLGLGLYIARKIVEAHGGDIRAESQVGCGSTFIVRLLRSAPA